MIEFSETYLDRIGGWCVVMCCASSLFCALRVDVVAVVGQTRCCTAQVDSQTSVRIPIDADVATFETAQSDTTLRTEHHVEKPTTF